mmetsp:Transcript_88369/g.161830  ORF Transcript_88369/g.161830 Transcript_88369/m.161830 type:complete len:1081 (+) Transcript_88369:111-3353(+)
MVKLMEAYITPLAMVRCFICLICFEVARAVREGRDDLEQECAHLGISILPHQPKRNSSVADDWSSDPDPPMALFLFVPFMMACLCLYFWWQSKQPDSPAPTHTTAVQGKFEDPELEESFQAKTSEAKVRTGARIMLLVNLMLWLKSGVQDMQENRCIGSGRVSGHGTVVRAIFTILSVVCIVKPREWLFYLILLQAGIYVLWTSLPPFDLACYELHAYHRVCPAEKIWRLRSDRLDCALQGTTAVQVCILFMLLIPWIIPKKKLLFLPWLWLGCAYMGTSVLIRHTIISDAAHWPSDIVLSSLLIAVAIIVASQKKISLDRSQRKIFWSDLKLQLATKKLYSLLDVMLPAHVIVPMLKNPGAVIAEEIECASILFIVIEDFDVFASKMTPDELLSFLNKYFTDFDGICAATKVTKIETVCEEYVACVGVSPEDRKTQAMMGHGHILQRLFQAAGQILDLQKEDVKFKMGLHTGPIVAGVIGSKLPRYRLFGDTINTAARMMQKGQSGALQFGEETWSKLPKTISARFRGEVEMKGKGKVKAYLFGEKRASTSLPQMARATVRKSQMIDLLHVHSKKKASDEDASPASKTLKDEIQIEDNFDNVMLQVAPEASGTRRNQFAPELEEKWQLWFYQHVVCGNMTRRINRLMLVFVILTSFDLIYMLWIQSWKREHEFYDASLRIPIMVLLRSICFLCLVSWRILSAQELLQSRPKTMQAAIMLSTATICILMYASYDAIGIMSKKMSRDEVHEIAYLNEQYSLLYTLLFFLIIVQIRCTFFESLFFIPLAALIMCLRNWTHLYISEQGRVVFLTTTLVRSVLAYEAEHMGRRRFQTNNKVEQMQDRLETILDTMMPPLVLQELRSRSLDDAQPPSSHKYLAACVAQSDLAGFTKLASQRKPSEVVEFIGDLFGRFDILTDKHKVYKVETIGDAYIAGSAEKPLTDTESPTNVVLFGLDMIVVTRQWARERGFDVICRVGVHRGECIGGIVGTDMQRYHLFGQLMWLVDILEATSLEGRVQVSRAVKEAVSEELQKRGTSEEQVLGGFEAREGDCLTTSKGEVHDFAEVGGRTYLVKEPKASDR